MLDISLCFYVSFILKNYCTNVHFLPRRKHSHHRICKRFTLVSGFLLYAILYFILCFRIVGDFFEGRLILTITFYHEIIGIFFDEYAWYWLYYFCNLFRFIEFLNPKFFSVERRNVNVNQLKFHCSVHSLEIERKGVVALPFILFKSIEIELSWVNWLFGK